ncbi:hypothetical protein PHYPSEUDO_013067 [Phytophthora pseudosyringae]|uniref:Uncharacterized protein n=1 Tax=Phytophthora pseudosyringae TaxID=221518 RepID=A0A8T1W3B5_9STRA|nr:hypothetical protein PHYPSEUDO_013067 [Phytophthora pseudosyringae]
MRNTASWRKGTGAAIEATTDDDGRGPSFWGSVEVDRQVAESLNQALASIAALRCGGNDSSFWGSVKADNEVAESLNQALASIAALPCWDRRGGDFECGNGVGDDFECGNGGGDDFECGNEGGDGGDGGGHVGPAAVAEEGRSHRVSMRVFLIELIAKFSATGVWLRLKGKPVNYENSWVCKSGFTTVCVKRRAWDFMAHVVGLGLPPDAKDVVLEFIVLTARAGRRGLHTGEMVTRNNCTDHKVRIPWHAHNVKFSRMRSAQSELYERTLLKQTASPDVDSTMHTSYDAAVVYLSRKYGVEVLSDVESADIKHQLEKGMADEISRRKEDDRRTRIQQRQVLEAEKSAEINRISDDNDRAEARKK